MVVISRARFLNAEPVGSGLCTDFRSTALEGHGLRGAELSLGRHLNELRSRRSQLVGLQARFGRILKGSLEHEVKSAVGLL